MCAAEDRGRGGPTKTHIQYSVVIGHFIRGFPENYALPGSSVLYVHFGIKISLAPINSCREVAIGG